MSISSFNLRQVAIAGIVVNCLCVAILLAWASHQLSLPGRNLSIRVWYRGLVSWINWNQSGSPGAGSFLPTHSTSSYMYQVHVAVSRLP